MNFSIVRVLGFIALASTACAVSPGEEIPSEETATTGTTSQALTNNYSCSEAGHCQCDGLADCNNMFGVCKAFLYCYNDAAGFRCSCWNYSPWVKK